MSLEGPFWIDTPLNKQIEMVAHLKYAGVLVPVEPQECKLMRSEPKALGSGEIVYEITLVSNEPANSLTMHNRVWLIGGDDGG